MKFNNYISSKISNIDKEDLCEDILENYQAANDFNVNSDEDYKIFFYLNNLIDEILEDTFKIKLSEDELLSLKKFVYSFKNDENYNLGDLKDLRILVYKWLKENNIKKEAYPNINGIFVIPTKIDLSKWTDTAHKIYEQIHNGISRQSALKLNTYGWDKDEVYKFDNWLRYYEEQTPEKYQVKISNIIKNAFLPNLTFKEEWENPENRSNTYFANDQKTKKELEIDKAKSFKSKMKSRLRSLKILIDKYNDLLPNQNLDKVYDEISNLEKSIGKLNVYAALKDRVIRSAYKMEKLGFSEGFHLLKNAVDIQTGPSDKTNLPEGQAKYNVETIINKLEGISKVLKMRETVRELSKADIMLSEMGMASYFPEITDALSKLIEGFGYASNRIEGVIAKLRGSGKIKTPEPTIPSPTIPASQPTEKLEPSSLHDIPSGKLQTKLPEKV